MTALAPACVICGAPEPFGLSVCPACGGTAHAVGDTLLFVKPDGSRADRRRVREALTPLLEGRTHGAERGLVAGGHRALIKLPAAAADRAVRQLALRGIPAVVRPLRRTWASPPLSFYLVLLSVVLVGGAAGYVAEPFMRWTSPLVAVGLLLAAQLRLRRPAIGAPKRRPVFPGEVEKEAVETFARLPAGAARDLLARLVRAAEPAYRASQATPAAARPHDIADLLTHACRAAGDLADLDEGLTVLEAQPGLERVQRLRDGLAARFRQGIRVLHRLRAETVDADPAQAELAELVVALDGEARAYEAARREVASLLRDERRSDETDRCVPER